MNKDVCIVQDAEWVPETDEDLILKHQELNTTFKRLLRRNRYPEYWDYRNPRTAGEYLENNCKRRRNKDRKGTTLVQRAFAASVGLWLFAVVLALLVG